MNFNKLLLFLLFLIGGRSVHGQILDITPIFPTINDSVTIIYDAAQGNAALVGVSPVYAHAGLITASSSSLTDWKYVQGSWGTADPKVLMQNLGNNRHQISYKITTFYNVPPTETVNYLSFVFRNAAGSVVGRAADGSDIYYPVYPANAGLLTRFVRPYTSPVIATVGGTIPIRAAANQTATMTILDNGTPLTQQTATLFDYNLTVTSGGLHTVKLVTTNGTQTVEDSFVYVVNSPVNYQNPPVGTQLGATYTSNNSVRLAFVAPNKDFVYVLGDFNNWQLNPNYYMNCSADSTTWWLDITGLTPGQEYAYQYFVAGEVQVGDPFSEKVLDPWNDGSIPALSYPNLIPYPTGKGSGVVSVLQTDKPAYPWQITNFTKPERTDLVVYELHLRDFLGRKNYATLLDTLDYLQNLGVNTIELMPVTEFEGNNSWGYNPNYHMALDKFYGTADAFKALVDECHARGIAVVIDVVFNHVFGTSPLAQLYWDGANNKPSPDNPWLNPDATHPFNVGYDVNHESQFTKDWIDRCLKYLINEYHLDGFRFDLSKGFTQVNNPNNVGAWSAYDASRITILKRIADVCWGEDPDFYVILEHLADNSEETELANYGMMLWGNMHYNYKQGIMGFNGSDFSWASYQNRGWSAPHVVAYMESHDEERQMYDVLNYGNSAGSYNTRNFSTAIERVALANTFFYTIPGPKMLWQFGELGYDYSINYCPNGTINSSCRTDPKPIRWDFFTDNSRRRLFDIYKALIHLKTHYPVFKTTTYDLALGGNTVKRIRLSDNNMKVVVLGNFALTTQGVNPNFYNTGTWYEFFTGDSLQVSNTSDFVSLQAGEYRIYTSQRITPPMITNTRPVEIPAFEVNIYPNPMTDFVTIEYLLEERADVQISVFNLLGQRVANLVHETQTAGLQRFHWDGSVSDGGTGQYIVQIRANGRTVAKRLMIVKR